MHSQQHHKKVRLSVECSINERTMIKVLAAKNHMTISDFLLAPVRVKKSPKKKNQPNAGTIKALKESREKKLTTYDTLEDFWEAMGIDPNA